MDDVSHFSNYSDSSIHHYQTILSNTNYRYMIEKMQIKTIWKKIPDIPSSNT